MVKSARRARKRPRAVSNGDGVTRSAPATDDRTIETIIASFAHEIRTPLTGVLAVADLLARSALGERERNLIQILKSSAEHVSALSSLVIDGVRARRKGLALSQAPFDLHELAHVLAASLDARCRIKGLTCSTSITDDLPADMVGDQVRLRAAVENLIDNAVKFTDAGEINLDISHVDGKVCFAVSDSGIGLTAAEIKRLFRPFVQASDGVGERFGGAGLGLAFVRRIARAMGGDVTASGTRGGGSVFQFTVQLRPAARKPRAKAVTPKMKPVVSKGPPTTSRKSEALKLNVLCAEDNMFGRVVIKTILTELGHSVFFVGSGVGAVAAASRRHRYDLVLMDIELAGLDGIEATRRIRALPGPAGKIPVIGISGSAEKEDGAYAAGMDAFLHKPLKAGKLASALDLVMRRPANATAAERSPTVSSNARRMQAKS